MCCVCLVIKSSNAQTQEAQQLLLNWEKLAQFKQMLEDMKTGYQVLYKGYSTIRDISQGNYSLHKTFLDGLMEVSPAVLKYKRVADIISFQIRIVKEYKSAYKSFQENGAFTTQELEHLAKVYSNLFNASLQNLDELSLVITAGKLRMSDDERLQAIDRIYKNIIEQYSFLQEFNNSTVMLALQRKSEMAELEMQKKIGGF